VNRIQQRLRLTLGGGSAFLLLGSPAVFAADVAADLHIDRVTVYREGAAVTRTGVVELPAGAHRLVIRGLPAAIDSKTLRVAVDSPAVRLGGIEVQKINEGKFATEAERELRRRIEETGDRRQAAQDEAATAQTQLKLLDSLAANPAGSPTKASVDGANLSAVLATISTSASAAHRRVREATLQLRTIDRELEKLKADLAKVATQSKQSTEIRTAYEASAASSSTVSVSYMIGDAGWRWIYEARLDTKTKRMSLDRQGQLAQGSGEDWKNVEVILTTAQPADDAATPVLGSQFLDIVEPERMRALQSRLGAAGKAAAPAESLQEIAVTGARRMARESATDYLAEYQIPGRVSVLADREPRLYPIAGDTFDVELVARIVPSASRAAHLEAAFKYDRDVPLESGRLQLYRDGAFVGEADAKVFLPGADVRMPFGADQRVRVAVHDEAAQSGQRGVITKQTLKETRRRFDITNYHQSAIEIEVVDRLPVSRNADVKVEVLKGATEPATKDLDGKAGVMLWKFTGEPQRSVTIRQYYSVQYPRDRHLEATEENTSE
jgi:uncharacterized protein (TIGR02231 family)